MGKSGRSKNDEEKAEAVDTEEHGTASEEQGEGTGPHPVVDLTDEKPPALRFYANLADL